MTANQIWQEIGAGESIITRLIRLIFMLAAAVAFCFLAVLPMSWPQQAVCGLLTLLMALALARSSDSYLITLTLMIMSMFCTFRYGYWRISTAVQFFRDPANHWGADRRFLYFLPAPGRDLCLHHPLPGVFPDHLAAAPRARGAAGRRATSGRMSTS